MLESSVDRLQDLHPWTLEVFKIWQGSWVINLSLPHWEGFGPDDLQRSVPNHSAVLGLFVEQVC